MINSSKKSFWRGRIIRYAPLILWIGVIAFMSSGQASMSQTSRFVRPLLEFLFPSTPEETLIIYHGYIRKLAHLTEYAILALFAARAFRYSANSFLHNNWLILSIVVVAIIATIDETNQSFNSARTGSVYDVLIDCFGGLSTLAFMTIFYSIRKSKLKN
jgi:VanZ family protein